MKFEAPSRSDGFACQQVGLMASCAGQADRNVDRDSLQRAAPADLLDEIADFCGGAGAERSLRQDDPDPPCPARGGSPASASRSLLNDARVYAAVPWILQLPMWSSA